MKALISRAEPRVTGYRVAQVQETTFDVAEYLFWVDCAPDVQQDLYWFDPSDNTCKPIVVESEDVEDSVPPETQTGVV